MHVTIYSVTMFHRDCLKMYLQLCLQKVILKFEESMGSNSVLALYHQTCIFKKWIIPNVQISFLLTSFTIWETTGKKWFSEVKNYWQPFWPPSWILAAILIFTLELRSKIKCLVMTYTYDKWFACRIIRTIICHNTLNTMLSYSLKCIQ